MVKTTAQTLQAFGTELAETELPNDAEATTNLLHTHTLKKDTMKVRHVFLSVPRMLTHDSYRAVTEAMICLISRRTCRWRCLRAAACWSVKTSLYRRSLNTAGPTTSWKTWIPYRGTGRDEGKHQQVRAVSLNASMNPPFFSPQTPGSAGRNADGV